MPDTVELLGLAPKQPVYKTADEIGVGALESEDFLKLFLAELQNQDPTEPTSNEQLLNQISKMRDLESSMSLEETLEDVVTALANFSGGRDLTSAASLIGRTVTGTDANGDEITGVVQSARIRDGEAFVTVDGTELKVADLESVEETPAAA